MNDWPILVLERAPAGVRPFHIGQPILEPKSSFAQQLLLPSYSVDSVGAQVPTVDSACSPRNPIWGIMVHDCKAEFGSSGASLLIRDQDWYALVGVHTGSMLAADEEGHVAESMGNSAVGAWAFADALQAVFRRLSRGEDVHRGGPHVY